jgi:hypothetical protein
MKEKEISQEDKGATFKLCARPGYTRVYKHWLIVSGIILGGANSDRPGE